MDSLIGFLGTAPLNKKCLVNYSVIAVVTPTVSKHKMGFHNQTIRRIDVLMDTVITTSVPYNPVTTE